MSGLLRRHTTAGRGGSPPLAPSSGPVDDCDEVAAIRRIFEQHKRAEALRAQRVGVMEEIAALRAEVVTAGTMSGFEVRFVTLLERLEGLNDELGRTGQ